MKQPLCLFILGLVGSLSAGATNPAAQPDTNEIACHRSLTGQYSHPFGQLGPATELDVEISLHQRFDEDYSQYILVPRMNSENSFYLISKAATLQVDLPPPSSLPPKGLAGTHYDIYLGNNLIEHLILNQHVLPAAQKSKSPAQRIEFAMLTDHTPHHKDTIPAFRVAARIDSSSQPLAALKNNLIKILHAVAAEQPRATTPAKDHAILQQSLNICGKIPYLQHEIGAAAGPPAVIPRRPAKQAKPD